MRMVRWEDSSHLTMRIEPSVSRFTPKKTLAAPFAFKLLWNKHLGSQLFETALFYDLVSEGGPGTADAAGWIFEFRMHQLLTQYYSLSFFPIGRTRSTSTKFDVYNNYTDSINGTNAEHFQLVV